MTELGIKEIYIAEKFIKIYPLLPIKLEALRIEVKQDNLSLLKSRDIEIESLDVMYSEDSDYDFSINKLFKRI